METFEDEKKRVRKFYTNNLAIIPPFSHWRQFKFRLWSGEFIVIKDTIKTAKDLQKHLVRHAPSDVYFSTSTFLDPQNVGPKKYNNLRSGYNWANNIFLGSGFYVDVDSENFEGVKNISKYLKNSFGFAPIIIKTGRGFQVHVYDDLSDYFPDLQGIADPKLRENAYHAIKVYITKKLKKLGIKFDEPISIDTRRVCRLAGSLHRNGVVCEVMK